MALQEISLSSLTATRCKLKLIHLRCVGST